MFSLGVMQIQGHGLPVDLEGGYRMLLRARARGIPPWRELTLEALRTTLPPDLVRRAEQTR